MFFALTGLATAGAQVAAGPLNFRQALELARSHSLAVAAAEARVRQAQAAVEARAAAWRPTVGLPIGYAHNDRGRFVAQNGQDEYTLQVSVHLPIFDPTREPAYRSARAQLESAAFQRDQARHDLDLQTLTAYFGLLQGGQELAVQRTGLSRLQAEEQAMQRRFAQGTSSRLDLERARFASAQQVSALTTAQSALRTARRHLDALTGILSSEEVSPPPAARRLNPADLQALAQAQRPELAAARSRLQSADADIEQAAAAVHNPIWGPDLSAGWNANGPPAAISGQQSWSAGVSLAVPLYSGGAAEAKVADARQARAALEAELQAQVRSIDLAIDDDQEAAAVAAKQERLAEQRVQLANAELEMTRFGYGQGSIPFVEVLRTQQAAIQASADLASTKLDWDLAQYRLLWDVGADL